MSMESDLTALLKTACPNTFPDMAPAGTVAPWVTYQAIGGQPMRWMDNTPADKRHTLLQINVWTGSRAATLALVRQIEELLCAASVFTAAPASEPISTAEADLMPPLYGSMQDFDIWSPR